MKKMILILLFISNGCVNNNFHNDYYDNVSQVNEGYA